MAFASRERWPGKYLVERRYGKIPGHVIIDNSLSESYG